MTKSYCPGIRRKYIFLDLHSDNTFETLENGIFGDCALSQVETQRQLWLSVKLSHSLWVTHSLDLAYKSVNSLLFGGQYMVHSPAPFLLSSP